MKKCRYDFNLSVIIPVYNDKEVLHELYKRLYTVLHTLCTTYEIIFIDDGSQDNSFRILRELQSKDENITVIKLTRNFGQADAITAGLEYVSAEVAVIMDSDLQDRPEDIEKLLDAMIEKDVPMAIARWVTREDSFFKVMVSRFFHFVTSEITNIHHVPRLGMFRALRKELIEELKKTPEKTATSLSLLNWMGYEYAIVDLNRDSRHAGASGYTIGKMLKLSLDRIFSYSLFPIQLSSIIGAIIGTSSIVLALYFLFQKIFLKNIVPGWTSLIVITLFLLGMNFIFLGIIGEYLGRIFLEAKQRPRYIIESFHEKRKKLDE